MLYPAGTKVQNRNGYIRRKTKDGEWLPESRAVLLDYGVELKEGDRVFHLDGDRTNNKKSNLVPIHFNQTRFTLLKTSKVIFIPVARAKLAMSGRLV